MISIALCGAPGNRATRCSSPHPLPLTESFVISNRAIEMAGGAQVPKFTVMIGASNPGQASAEPHPSTVGDRVRVEINFDASYRSGPQHPIPRWFKRALADNPQAMKSWTALIPSRKKEILRYFSRLNSQDARARNLAKALSVLSGKMGRFMARTWKNGS
jgi:bacteriocin resistance YdeI/OmpD-like protein